MEINEEAPVITRDEILIDAPIETAWEIQTNVAEWPSWQPELDSAHAEGPLEVGSVFRWETAGLDVTSTVEEIDPPRRIAWRGAAPGLDSVHIWSFEPWNEGVLVRTEGSWEGDPVTANVETMQGALDGSLRGWLENLKGAAEKRAR